jgi:RNA polymerase sigma-70 factor (ECF subfamily)
MLGIVRCRVDHWSEWSASGSRDGFPGSGAFTGVDFDAASRAAMPDRRVGAMADDSRAAGLGEFLLFYDDSVVPLFRYLCRLCGGDRALAEDLAQETFVTALVQFNTGGVEPVTLGWLLVVARHKFVDHFRRLEVENRKLVLVGWPSRCEVIDGSDDELLAALRSLPPLQRAAIMLRYSDDLSVRAVSDVLGKSRRATESLLARGLRNLRSGLSQGGDDG